MTQSTLPKYAIQRLEYGRFGYSSEIMAIGYFCDGERFYAVTNDDLLRVWDVESGQLLGQWKLKDHGEEIRQCCFSPDNRHFVYFSGSDDEDYPIFVLDTESGEHLASLKGHTGNINRVSFLPDGRLVSASGDESVRIWDLKEAKECLKIDDFDEDDDSTLRFRCANGGKHIAITRADKSLDEETKSGYYIGIRDVENGKTTFQFEADSDYVWDLTFSPDNELIAHVSDKMVMWCAKTGEKKWEEESFVGYSIAFSPDGAAVAGSKEDEVYVFEASTGKKLWSAERGYDDEYGPCIAFSPCGSRLAVADDRGICFYDSKTGKKMDASNSSITISKMQVSEDGRRLLGCYRPCEDGEETWMLWDLEQGKKLRDVKGSLLSMTPDGKVLLSVTQQEHSTLTEENLESGSKVAARQENSRFHNIQYSPDGKYIATKMTTSDFCEQKQLEKHSIQLQLWDANSGKVSHQFESLTSDKTKILSDAIAQMKHQFLFSPDGDWLLEYDEQSEVRVWEIEGRKKSTELSFTTMDSPDHLAFSPNSKWLAYVDQNGANLNLRDFKGGKHCMTFYRPNLQFYSVAFSPDGRYLLTGCNDGKIRFWDLEFIRFKDQGIVVFETGQSSIHSLHFCSDGTLISGGGDATILQWRFFAQKEKVNPVQT